MASSDLHILAAATTALLRHRRMRRWLAITLAIPLVTVPALLIADATSDLSPTLRIAGLIVSAVATCIAFGNALRPVHTEDPLSRGEAALGEIDRLFTAARQLAVVDDPRAQAHAVTLAAQLPAVDDLTARLRLGLPPARAWPAVLVGFSALIALAVIKFTCPNVLAACIPRFIHPYGDYPPYSATRLTWRDPPSEARYNEAILLTVAVAGPVPQDLLLHASIATGDGDSDGRQNPELPGEIHLLPAGEGLWQVRLESPTDPLRLWVSGAGTRTRWLDLPLDGVPRLRGASVELTAPGYANLPVSRVRCLPSTSTALPTLAALAGSRLRFDLACSRPPLAVWLQKGGRGEAGSVPQRQTQVEVTTSEPGRDAAIQVTLADPEPGEWSVSLEGLDGTRGTPVPVINLTRRVDQPPTVRIAMPEDGAYATPGISVPFHVHASDDLGLAQLTLYRLIGDRQVSEGRHSLGGTGDTWRGSIKLDDVKPGDQVRLGAVVRDTAPPSGQLSAPAEVTLTIIALDTYLALARDQISEQALLMRFEPVLAKLAEFEETARRLSAEPPAAERPSAERDAKLAELAKQIAATRADLAEQAKLELFAADGEVFAAVDQRLAELAKDAKDGFPKGAGEDQAKQLGDDLAHLTAQAEADAVQDWVNDLAKAQRTMAKEFTDLAKNSGEKPSDMQQARMRELARQQVELEQSLKELASQAEAVSKRLAAGRDPQDKKQAKKFTEMSQALAEAATPAGEAARHAGRGRAEPAAKGADTAATALEKMVSERDDPACKNGWCSGDKLAQCRSQLAAMAKRGMGQGGSPHSQGGGAALGSFGGGRYTKRGGDAQANHGKPLYGPVSAVPSGGDKRGGPGRDGQGGAALDAGAGSAEPTPYARDERATTAGIGTSLTPTEERLVDDYFRGLNEVPASNPSPAPNPSPARK